MRRDGGYIVEFTRLGNSLKVTAIDPVTMMEVSLVGSPRASQKELSDLAVRKLQYVIEKKRKK